MSQKVYHEHFSVVYTMKPIAKYVFHEMFSKKYFTVYSRLKLTCTPVILYLTLSFGRNITIYYFYSYFPNYKEINALNKLIYKCFKRFMDNMNVVMETTLKLLLHSFRY